MKTLFSIVLLPLSIVFGQSIVTPETSLQTITELVARTGVHPGNKCGEYFFITINSAREGPVLNYLPATRSIVEKQNQVQVVLSYPAPIMDTEVIIDDTKKWPSVEVVTDSKNLSGKLWRIRMSTEEYNLSKKRRGCIRPPKQ